MQSVSCETLCSHITDSILADAAGWLARVLRSSRDQAAFASIWRDLDSLVGDLSSHLALSNRTSMDKLLKAKQPDFLDESAALRSKVAALGGIAAVTADMNKMQQVMHRLFDVTRALVLLLCSTVSVRHACKYK